MTRKAGPLRRPETHDKRPGMGTPEEMYRYRLAQRVTALRLMQADGQGWSQHELARRCQVSQTTISRLEAGQGCHLDVLMALARVFGMSTDFLLGRQRTPKAYHELVDEAYETVCSLASSLDYTVENPYEVTLRHFQNTIEMVARSRQRLVDLMFRIQYPNMPASMEPRVPYGYEFVEEMEKAYGGELDR